MRERLRARDYRFIAVCLALLAGTTWFSVKNFYRAFPEASPFSRDPLHLEHLIYESRRLDADHH